jgi:hypothetical protein
VLVQSNGPRTAVPYASQSNSQAVPIQDIPVEEITPGEIPNDSFDGAVEGEGVIAEPSDGYEYENGFGGEEPSPLPCGIPGCNGGCNTCQQGGQCLPEWRYNASCEPRGLFQRLSDLHDENAIWTGRIDALILWRNAPPVRPLVEAGNVSGLTLFNANQLDSTAAAGPRVSIFRTDKCSGNAWEATYLRAANFRSQRYLPEAGGPYTLSPPGIYGNQKNFDSGSANLGSSLQSFEFNRLVCHGRHLRWLAGFRWVEWNEQFTLSDTVAGTPPINDLYQTGCVNSMYGGQIGLDAYLLSLSWLRVDSVIKAGAFYNNAVQNSLYQSNDSGTTNSQSATVGQSPASCAFIGEIGFTGIMPITDNIDFRIGYFCLWLSGIAQPTQQLSGQQIDLTNPAVATINTNGGTVAQGVSLGLEGRW